MDHIAQRRFPRRDPLVAKLVTLLEREGLDDVDQRARQLAGRLEYDGCHTAHVWRADHEDSSRARALRWEWEQLREATIRHGLVAASWDRNRLKLGNKEEALKKATARAIRHWDRRLTCHDRRAVRVPPPRPYLWENAVSAALIQGLEAGLGRSLRSPRTVPARCELRVLVSAFELVRVLTPPPPLLRGKGVRQPGGERWFASRVATHLRQRAASEPDQTPHRWEEYR